MRWSCYCLILLYHKADGVVVLECVCVGGGMQSTSMRLQWWYGVVQPPMSWSRAAHRHSGCENVHSGLQSTAAWRMGMRRFCLVPVAVFGNCMMCLCSITGGATA